MNFPKVSIMIPTYNQDKYIGEAIESALFQDYPNLEVVISDDCSNDTTEEIVKKYSSDSRVKYIKNSSNLGRVGNYHNTLFFHTTGEWVINLDGDDYYIDSFFISRAINEINAANVLCDNIVAYCNNKNAKLAYIKKNMST